LCAMEDRFVMSDGSSTLTFRDLDSFQVVGTVEVVSSGQPVDKLNELECVGELVYANVWFTDEIVVIAADSGKVVARVDASSLRGELSSIEGIDVLNGIAHDPDRRVFYLTGKLWPEIFEVRIDRAA
ncbi:MAG: glutaminyl-peptide cyclotransferase, partial [bacterium]|nr:glutaminyl-peptide cyclotransferase [bacterium]